MKETNSKQRTCAARLAFTTLGFDIVDLSIMNEDHSKVRLSFLPSQDEECWIRHFALPTVC